MSIQDNEMQLTITETFSCAPRITMATGYELNAGTFDRPSWWFSQELKKELKCKRGVVEKRNVDQRSFPLQNAFQWP